MDGPICRRWLRENTVIDTRCKCSHPIDHMNATFIPGLHFSEEYMWAFPRSKLIPRIGFRTRVHLFGPQLQ